MTIALAYEYGSFAETSHADGLTEGSLLFIANKAAPSSQSKHLARKESVWIMH